MLMTTYDLSFMEEGRINNWPYTKYILKPLSTLGRRISSPWHSKKQRSGTKYCLVLSKEPFSYFLDPVHRKSSSVQEKPLKDSIKDLELKFPFG